MKIEKEEELFRKRILELERLADRRYCPVYSDFLNMNEISVFLMLGKELSGVPYTMYGGYDGAERKMVCFHGDGGEDERSGYPIACVHIRPANAKFSDALTHRDYLGAILNLGIDRCKTGDILIRSNEAYLFCHESIADFICDTLVQVRHTVIRAERTDAAQAGIEPEYQEIAGTLSSVRLDSMISLAFHESRSSLTDAIAAGRVFVNGRVVTSNSFSPKEGDIISVRGLGRFRFEGTGSRSKKGRIGVTLLKYI